MTPLLCPTIKNYLNNSKAIQDLCLVNIIDAYSIYQKYVISIIKLFLMISINNEDMHIVNNVYSFQI